MKFRFAIAVALLITNMAYNQVEELQEQLSLMETLESQRDIDAIKEKAPAFLSLASKKPKSIYHAWAKHYYGAFRWRIEPDTCLQLELEAYEQFKYKNDLKGWVKSALGLGIIHFNFVNELNKSNAYFEEAIQLLEKRGTQELGDSLKC